MNKEILTTLAAFGITGQRAKSLALNELQKWHADDLASILGERVSRPSLDHKPLGVQPSDNGPEDHLNKGSTVSSLNRWVRPPWDMVKTSARDGLALCVNSDGQFRLVECGYMSISHAWIEGIQLDRGAKGISHAQLSRIFSAIQCTGAEWIWLDVLAIPKGGGPVATVEEDLVKIDLINAMAGIYERADAVIVLDALLLQMHPASPVDIAVGLVCGKWLTRLWTYNEVKMAKKALLVTATRVFDFHELVAALDLLCAPNAKIEPLFRELYLLQPEDRLDISLPDIVLGCQNRVTGNDIDYARALFPLLGLKWRHGLTKEQAMELIYASQPRSATRLVAMHGNSRLATSPGWAPSQLVGLQGRIAPASNWETRGLRGPWFDFRVDSARQVLIHEGRRGLELRLYNHEGSKTFCECWLAATEVQVAIDAFFKAVDQGTAVILSKVHLDSAKIASQGFAEVVLLAEQVVEGLDLDAEPEVYVHCTTVVIYVDKSCWSTRSMWLLRHQNPTQLLEGLGPFLGSWVHRIFTHKDENLLHLAVRRGDAPAVLHCLKNGFSPNSKDSKEWTPLHTAASCGHADIADILIRNRSDIEAVERGGITCYGRTPLLLAAEKGQEAVVDVLLKAGANIKVNEQYLTPLGAAAWKGRVEAVERLLIAKADVNWSDHLGFTPLLLAADGNHAGVMRKLLKRGASIEGCHTSGLTPLHRASEHGSVEAIELLLHAGANKEAKMSCDWTPIRYAVQEQHADVVRVLLQEGANPNPIYRGGFRPLMISAYLGHPEITRLLIQHGVDVNVRTEPEGYTPLHFAAKYGKVLVLKMMLRAGAQIDARDSSGATPLQVAMEQDHHTVVATLVRHACSSPLGMKPQMPAADATTHISKGKVTERQ